MPDKACCHLDYKTIQKLIVTLCYCLYLGWSFCKMMFKDEPGFLDVANKVDMVVAAFIGVLLRFTYGLGQTLQSVSNILPPELSRRFDSMFNIVSKNNTNVEKLSEDVKRMSMARINDPFALSEVPYVVSHATGVTNPPDHISQTAETIDPPDLISPRTDASNETIRMFEVNPTRTVNMRFPRELL